MARFDRAIFIGACVLGSLMAAPCRAEQVGQIAAALPGVAGTSDPVMKKAIDYLLESKNAMERKDRREGLKPVSPDRVVHHSDSDHVMILGGGAAIPM